MNVDLKDAKLAVYLAAMLTDLEFEMLLRERIKLMFTQVHEQQPNLSESYNLCVFRMSWADTAHWEVRIGETYNKSADVEGQVLSRCMDDVLDGYNRKDSNKLSLLLPAPAPKHPLAEEDEDKTW